MRRTGRSLLILVLAASPAFASSTFYQTVDRNEVGTEDTFTLTITLKDPPADARMTPGKSDDFEVLASHTGVQSSFSIGPNGSQISRAQTLTLTMRANREGKLTIPPATVTSSNGTEKTEAITITAKKGTLNTGSTGRGRPQLIDPFSGLPLDDFFGGGAPDPVIPRSDSDLFLRASLSDKEVYVGQQVVYSIHIYSRVDVSSVDPVVMPKLEGFWSEDIDVPTHLSSDVQEVNGIPYRVYSLRRRALFPMRPGTFNIEPARTEIDTGFFEPRRYKRSTNEVTLKVKPLPPGAPAGMNAANVGTWRLFTEVSGTTVQLGSPVTIKVILEGRGNLKNVTPPPLPEPKGLKVYKPTVTDKMAITGGRVSGRRVHEYLVLPQRTGEIKIPGLAFPYFDPAQGRYEVSKTDDIVLTVTPSGSGVVDTADDPTADPARNVLSAGGIRPPRASSKLEAPKAPLYLRPYFIPLAIAPLALFGLSLVVSAVRGRAKIVDEGALKKQKVRDARKRLSGAEKLKGAKPDEFYGEVEKALLSYIEGKLGYPVQGLTRDVLISKLKASNIAEEPIKSVVAVLDACDTGRFAPGAATLSRDQVLDLAESAIEGFKA